MSKLTAFRMVEALAPAFEAKRLKLGLSATEALNSAVRAWTQGDSPQPAASRPAPSKRPPQAKARVRGFDALTGQPLAPRLAHESASHPAAPAKPPAKPRVPA